MFYEAHVVTLKNWEKTKPEPCPHGNIWLTCAHLGSTDRKQLLNLLSRLLICGFGEAPRENPGFMFQDTIFTWAAKVWDSLENYTQSACLCAAGLKAYSWNVVCYTSHKNLSIGWKECMWHHLTLHLTCDLSLFIKPFICKIQPNIMTTKSSFIFFSVYLLLLMPCISSFVREPGIPLLNSLKYMAWIRNTTGVLTSKSCLFWMLWLGNEIFHCPFKFWGSNKWITEEDIPYLDDCLYVSLLFWENN